MSQCWSGSLGGGSVAMTSSTPQSVVSRKSTSSSTSSTLSSRCRVSPLVAKLTAKPKHFIPRVSLSDHHHQHQKTPSPPPAGPPPSSAPLLHHASSPPPTTLTPLSLSSLRSAVVVSTSNISPSSSNTSTPSTPSPSSSAGPPSLDDAALLSAIPKLAPSSPSCSSTSSLSTPPSTSSNTPRSSSSVSLSSLRSPGGRTAATPALGGVVGSLTSRPSVPPKKQELTAACVRRRQLHRGKRKHSSTTQGPGKYCEEMNQLNEVANNRPRGALIHSIRQENRYIRELQEENKELRQALEEQQDVMELIMSKYREQVAKLLNTSPDLNTNDNTAIQRKLSANIERVSEMAMIMRKAAQLDEVQCHQYQQMLTSLTKENKGLREMLQIAIQSGSVSGTPKLLDVDTQTDGDITGVESPVSTDEDFGVCESPVNNTNTIKLKPSSSSHSHHQYNHSEPSSNTAVTAEAPDTNAVSDCTDTNGDCSDNVSSVSSNTESSEEISSQLS